MKSFKSFYSIFLVSILMLPFNAANSQTETTSLEDQKAIYEEDLKNIKTVEKAINEYLAEPQNEKLLDKAYALYQEVQETGGIKSKELRDGFIKLRELIEDLTCR